MHDYINEHLLWPPQQIESTHTGKEETRTPRQTVIEVRTTTQARLMNCLEELTPSKWRVSSGEGKLQIHCQRNISCCRQDKSILCECNCCAPIP